MTDRFDPETAAEHPTEPDRQATPTTQMQYPQTAEQHRLREADCQKIPWRLWGPYLSERQWGTVREDYSANGDAWTYLPHEHARSRAYRWGEDGLAGICDESCRLCFAIGLWNERDPILKERLFGLTNHQGNHGEDVKELYYYLDATPTHSYLKMLYKYPQREFPYARLVEENQNRSMQEREFEILDSGIFDDDHYFDVFVEFAKATPTDISILVTIHNRGPEDAPIHLLGQLWFRNRWAWKPRGWARPSVSIADDGAIEAIHSFFGPYCLYSEDHQELLFTENQTNKGAVFGSPQTIGYFKDAFHDFVVGGRRSAVNPSLSGTKSAAYHRRIVPARASVSIRMRLTEGLARQPFADFDSVVSARRAEADAYYEDLQWAIEDKDARLVQRQALAGMIWSKQFYHYDVAEWLKGDPLQPAPPAVRRQGRNHDWMHVSNSDIVSMPDKWEYPWYAAWDLAFHCIPFARLDPEFAKAQLVLLTREWYMHPNGQLPAYEWAFGDVNPPLHAWACWRVFQIDRKLRGDQGDLAFLERVFHKLMLNFTWWVNRKDAQGRNIFQGGFLGLDNIGVFDRSKPLPTGGTINQADGTSWMGMYCLNLMRMALELALHNPVYEDIATKFFEHFLHIAEALTNIGEQGIGLWDEQDEFFYDELQLPDGKMVPLKVRSMVGLIPLFAVETLEPQMLEQLPGFNQRIEWFLNYRPDLAALVSRWQEPGLGERHLLSLLRGHRMKCLLKRVLDETEFLSDHGVRSLSKRHSKEPYLFQCNGHFQSVEYWPGESQTGLFGGNSNWRGPIWMPVNYLIVESIQKFHHYYGDDFLVECPTGSGKYLTLEAIGDEISNRLTKLFLRDANGQRPIFGNNRKLQEDPHFRDCLLFHEYFHGETGEGLGACHQTGWTGLVAKLLQPRRPERSAHFRGVTTPSIPPQT